MNILTKAKSLFSGKTTQLSKSPDYKEGVIAGFIPGLEPVGFSSAKSKEIVGGFAPGSLPTKNKQLEEMIREVSASAIPVSQKDQLVMALKKMRLAVDSTGKLDLEKLSDKTIQEIEQHLLSVSKAAAKPKPATRPLVTPPTRPAAKSSTKY